MNEEENIRIGPLDFQAFLGHCCVNSWPFSSSFTPPTRFNHLRTVFTVGSFQCDQKNLYIGLRHIWTKMSFSHRHSNTPTVTYSDTLWHTLTHSDTLWHTVTLTVTKWQTIYNRLRHSMTSIHSMAYVYTLQQLMTLCDSDISAWFMTFMIFYAKAMKLNHDTPKLLVVTKEKQVIFLKATMFP